jgi:hypothetical protein
MPYTIELRYGRGSYRVVATVTNPARASMIYAGHNGHSGHNKRLRCDGVTIARLRTYKAPNLRPARISPLQTGVKE